MSPHASVDESGAQEADRRTILRTAGIAVIGGLAGCAAPTSDDGAGGSTGTEGGVSDADASLDTDAWPMFRGSDHNGGYNPHASGPGPEPSLAWAFETSDSIWSSPVVADERVYVGSYDGNLYAVDVEDGTETWRFETDDRIDGSPAVVDGTVYVGSFDRRVYAIDAETGAQEWAFETGGIVRSSPTVVDGVVYVGSHCRTTECARFYDEEFPETGFVHAIDAATGETRWSFPVEDEVLSSPAVGAETVYVGSADETVYAIDRESGTERWQYDADQPVFGSPALDGDRLYVTSNRSLVHAVDATTGDREWTYDPGVGVLTGSPAVAEGYVFVGGGPVTAADFGNEFCTLQAIDAAGGTEVWSTDVAGEVIGASPAVADDTVYIGSHNNAETTRPVPRLVAYATSGERRWELRNDEAPFGGLVGFGSSPAVVGDTLYVGNADGTLYALGGGAA